MRLSEYVARYGLERGICKKYIGSLETIARQLGEFCGGEIRTRELSSEFINPWIASIEANGLRTAGNKRLMIGILWRAAHEAGMAPPVGRLRSVKVPRKDPEALTIEEVQQLLAATDRMLGCFQRTKTPRAVYWKSLYLAYWDTALRISDLRSIERPWIWPGGVVSIVQSKVQRSHRVQLRPETIALINQLMAGRNTGLIWGVLNHSNFFTAQRKLFAAAGVRGSGKWMRRSSASYVEQRTPGMGWRHLGHAKPGIAESFYLDPAIIRPNPTLPPPLIPPP